MNVKNETGREMVLAVHPVAIDRVSERLEEINGKVKSIIEKYNNQKKPKENLSLSVSQKVDLSGNASVVETQDPLDQLNTTTDSDEISIVNDKSETPIRQVEENETLIPQEEEDQSQDLVDSIPSDEEEPLPDREVVLQEMAKQINALIEEFLSEAQGILSQYTQDSGRSTGESDPLLKEQAINRFRRLVSEFREIVREIPGVNDRFFELYSLMLKDPEMVRGMDGKSVERRTKKSPPPPTDSDGPSGRKTILGKVKGWVGRLFNFNRERSEEEKNKEKVSLKVHA